MFRFAAFAPVSPALKVREVIAIDDLIARD
jgi:hypothetical protein